jgi:hypothetical protein
VMLRCPAHREASCHRRDDVLGKLQGLRDAEVGYRGGVRLRTAMTGWPTASGTRSSHLRCRRESGTSGSHSFGKGASRSWVAERVVRHCQSSP